MAIPTRGGSLERAGLQQSRTRQPQKGQQGSLTGDTAGTFGSHVLKHGRGGQLVSWGPASTVWIFVRTGKRCGKGAEGTLAVRRCGRNLYYQWFAEASLHFSRWILVLEMDPPSTRVPPGYWVWGDFFGCLWAWVVV